MKNYILKTNDFTLEFELKVFDKDVNIPTNSILNIKINSDNFGAITTMDIDIKMFQKFLIGNIVIYWIQINLCYY